MKQENSVVEKGKKMRNMKETKGTKASSVICVLAAGVLWGCMGLLVRTMNASGIAAIEVVICRSVIASAAMGLIMLMTNKSEFRIRLKDIWCFIGTGILSVVFFNVCYFTCMTLTSLSTAAILLYTAPSFVMVMSFFLFKEKLTVKTVAALVLAFAGCVLVSGGITGLTLSIPGLLTGLGAGFGYALYSIFSKYAIIRGYSSKAIIFYTFVFASVGCLPFVKIVDIGIKLMTQAVSAIIIEIILILTTTTLAYMLYTKGLEGLDNGKASIIASVEPVVATLVGLLVYGEGLTLPGVIGMILVLGSCILVA